nr:hypothetical protein [Tanacetum cinerariifolium]
MSDYEDSTVTYTAVSSHLEAPPSLDYVPGPEHQPSPVYVPEFVPEPFDLDEDPEDDPKENPADYPADEGDEGNDEDKSSDDDEDDDNDIEETETFESDESVATPPPHPVYRVTARTSIRPQTPISFPSDTEIARLMAIPTPPPLLLSSLSSPLPQIPSPPLPLLLLPPTDPTYEEAHLGYRAARHDGRLRGEIPEADLTL